MTWGFLLARIEADERSRDAAEVTLDRTLGQEEFAAFYGRAARPLWAYLARTSGDSALAEDLMQESFVRFLCAERSSRHWVEEGEVAARKYLFRIASNLLKDHWRRPQQASIEGIPEATLAEGERSAETDARMMLVQALTGMRPRDRQILWLAYAEDYTHREIAEITGLGSASVRLLLFRARRKMAERLNRRTA